MPGEAQFIRLMPIIVRLFPQLVKATFYRGSVVTLNKVTPSPDEDLERELNRKIKQKSADKSKDNQMVVKVSDAVACIEKGFNDTTLIKEFILTAAKALLEGRQSVACGQRMFDQMATCVRQKALRQDTPRAAHRTTRIGRPAKGHGKGRKGF